MARIVAPNREYAGISAGVSFDGGTGSTDDPRLIDWFRAHGYGVEDAPARSPQDAPEGAGVQICGLTAPEPSEAKYGGLTWQETASGAGAAAQSPRRGAPAQKRSRKKGG